MLAQGPDSMPAQHLASLCTFSFFLGRSCGEWPHLQMDSKGEKVARTLDPSGGKHETEELSGPTYFFLRQLTARGCRRA